MAQAFLLFNFGSDEEVAQKARLRVEAWKQAFRLGNKLQLKLERKSLEEPEDSRETKNHEAKGKHSARKEGSGSEAKAAERIRLFVRLDFSAHEKHLFQTWLDRIPSEEPFKSAKPERIQRDAENFEQTVELFDSLD
jgi:hypothetical protein